MKFKNLKLIKIFYKAIYISLLFLIVFVLPAQSTNDSQNSGDGVALRDLAQIQGVRINQLLGYGLVVGLAGTGDSRSRFASNSIQNLLGGLGQKIDLTKLSETKNIAAVLVTADVPIFSKSGSRISALVSSIGDARSLEGGILIQTPLYAGNQEIYAVAQGSLTTGGRSSGSSGSSSKNAKTVANLLQGVIIEKEVKGEIFPNSENQRKVRISLNNFSFSTLSNLQKKLSETFQNIKITIDGATILFDIPNNIEPIAMIAQIENIKIKPAYKARVVINERSGTIVMGGDVKIDPVAISRMGNELKINGVGGGGGINSGLKLGKSSDTSGGGGEIISREFSGGSVNELIQALNSMKADVKDIISIFEALKDSGALHAELIVN